MPVAEFTARTVREYVAAKRAEAAAGSGLSTSAILSTVRVLSMVLDDAVEQDVLAANPARGAVKLRASKPRRSWLTAAEVNALLDAAGQHAALLGTMALAGLRVSEACALRWRNVDLARGTLTVEAGKTDAASRTIDLWPDLRSLLAVHRADHADAPGDEHVFLSQAGTPRTRHGVRRRVLQPAIERANERLVKAGRAPITCTCHSLRRTFASLMYAGGATPAEVQQAMGHTSPALALSMYVTVMSRNADTGDRVAALLAAEREPVAA